MSDEWVERGLVAEAVRQCQMEELKYREGKLDFDGVEPELGMHLLSLHWNRQHHSFLLTHRPAFMRDMACNGPYFSKLLLNAIYFGASKFSPRLEVRRDADDVRTAGWRFRERVRELLGGSLDRSDVTTIQALLVMTNSLFALGDERSAAWLYSGLAFRMLIDLGMHVDLSTTGRFSDEDLEIRRRVFWGAFVVDKVQSLYQGRPVSLKENDALVPIKFLDSYEELEHWQPFAYSTAATDYPGSPAYSISTFTFLCKLSLVMSDILSCIYTERSSSQTPTELSTMLGRLQRRLCAWKSSLPVHLQFDPSRPPSDAKAFPPPHVFSLHAMYHVLVILLHRPFVADGHLYSTSRSISVESFMKCASAASSIVLLLRAYHFAFSVQPAPYLISYATYVAATIHSRIAAKRGHESTAYSNLATCLAVFQINQKTNPAVRKATLIVQSLMKKLGVVIATIPGDALEMDQAGLFIHRKDLPDQQSDWAPHLISALGSQGADPRQIDGIGGGTSTTSKVAVISPSNRPGIDVDFTFVQVEVGKESVDFTGNCGNIVSGVGPFAVQEGLVDVRIFNTNTCRKVIETLAVDENGSFLEDGDFAIPGVNSTGSEVKVAFIDPAGSVTGRLFPSGRKQETLTVSAPPALGEFGRFEVRVTLVDAANPFVLVDAASISGPLSSCSWPDHKDMLVEAIRREGAVAMGLAATVEAAAKTKGTPKIALIYPKASGGKTASDVWVQAYSMGRPHPSLQLTGAVCIAAALNVPGTVAAELSTRNPAPELKADDLVAGGEGYGTEAVIAHGRGQVTVGVVVGRDGDIESCEVSRTARRLMEGVVRYYI
ncbi:hypothetical protein PLICBS_005128 [Purpureocillium lilacinum]|uniref:uncharacterized protein n=1 Tax=Purpureocillium lilacinum TaxID=33203 RepID=UPI00207DE871|nr:hypothetical protein PLICBS_005128 [Purpureocillium lilacinum]